MIPTSIPRAEDVAANAALQRAGRLTETRGALATPAVSVLMPAYNAGAFLGPAIESILTQTWSDFEFVIIDDGSTDGTRERIEEYARRDSRIRSCPNPRNMGVVKTLNRGLTLVRAPWIARMDADDISYPRRLELQLQAARRNPQASLITSPFDVLHDENRIEPGWRGICFQPELLPFFLLFYNRLSAHGQVMFSAAAVNQVGGYRDKYHLSEATELWLRLVRQGEFVVVKQPLYAWRATNPNSVTKQNTFRYAEFSLLACMEELKRTCGAEVTRDEAVALRDFWVRFERPEEVWRMVDELLTRVAASFRPPRFVPGWDRRVRIAIACGWLAHAVVQAKRLEGAKTWAHLRRSYRFSRAWFLSAVLRFVYETVKVGGRVARRA